LPKTENRFFPAAGAASAAVVDPARRTTHPNLILAICCMSLLIVGMDVTIVNVALPATWIKRMERETIQAIPKAQVATRFGQCWNGVELQNYFHLVFGFVERSSVS
jgi:hypothetical protein